MPVHDSSIVVLIIRWSKLYYTTSAIVTPVGGRSVHRTTTYTASGIITPIGVMILEAMFCKF